ncbi:hypothetical protein J6590_072662 [Homalodisca vitripennis]|nr:hypothetical protein J6590_072662 [Homalodisca vitripennis]
MTHACTQQNSSPLSPFGFTYTSVSGPQRWIIEVRLAELGDLHRFLRQNRDYVFRFHLYLSTRRAGMDRGSVSRALAISID